VPGEAMRRSGHRGVGLKSCA